MVKLPRGGPERTRAACFAGGFLFRGREALVRSKQIPPGGIARRADPCEAPTLSPGP